MPDRAVFAGSGFRRCVGTSVASDAWQSSGAVRRIAAPVCYASLAPRWRTLACQPRTAGSAAAGTAKATANPRSNQLQPQLPKWYHAVWSCVHRNSAKQQERYRAKAWATLACAEGEVPCKSPGHYFGGAREGGPPRLEHGCESSGLVCDAGGQLLCNFTARGTS